MPMLLARLVGSATLIILAVGLTQASFVALALRWIRMANPVVPAPALDHLRMYLHGLFLNTFTPGNLGGDVYRTYALRRRADGITSIILVLIQERLIGLLTFLVGYLVCALFLIPMLFEFSPLFGIAVLPVAAGVFALLLLPRLMGWLLEAKYLRALVAKVPRLTVLKKVSVFGPNNDVLVLSVYSLVSLAFWLAAINVVAADLSLSLAFTTVGAIAILTELVRTIPLSLQGIGLREATFAVLTGFAGGSPEVGFVVGALGYLALSACLLLNGVFAFVLGMVFSE